MDYIPYKIETQFVNFLEEKTPYSDCEFNVKVEIPFDEQEAIRNATGLAFELLQRGLISIEEYLSILDPCHNKVRIDNP